MEQVRETAAIVLKQLDWVDQFGKEEQTNDDVIQGGHIEIGWKLNDTYPYDHTKFTSEQFLHHLTGGERSKVDPSLRQLMRDSFLGATRTFFADDSQKDGSNDDDT